MAKLKLGIVILAAGAASRFGRCKQLAEFQHKPLLQHVIDEAKQLDAQELVVVTGSFPVAAVAVAASAFDDCFVLLSAIAPVLL